MNSINTIKPELTQHHFITTNNLYQHKTQNIPIRKKISISINYNHFKKNVFFLKREQTNIKNKSIGTIVKQLCGILKKAWQCGLQDSNKIAQFLCDANQQIMQ